jgi:hypothetical protein
VPKRRDAKLFQVLVRQARENRLVYVVLAEDRLVLPEAQAPQPDHNVHDGAPTRHCGHFAGSCPRGSLVTGRSYYYPRSFSGILKVGRPQTSLKSARQEGPIRSVLTREFRRMVRVEPTVKPPADDTGL